jgi:hypothetical protein
MGVPHRHLLEHDLREVRGICHQKVRKHKVGKELSNQVGVDTRQDQWR